MASSDNVGSLVVRLRAENKDLLSALKESQRAIKDLEKRMDKASIESGKAIEDLFTKVNAGVDESANNVKKKTNSMKKAFKSMSTIAGGFIQAQLMMKLAALPGQLITSAKEATLAFDRIDRRLRFVMGSAEKAAVAFKELDGITNKYGVDLKASAQFYTSFLAATEATNIALADSKALFLGTTQAAVALQMSTDQTKASFRAFQQMASKGRVAAEELRGQLGEALPGALGIAARAMDMPIEQMSRLMEKGGLLAEDLLPKMAKELQNTFGAAALDAANTYLAALNRIDNEWFKMLAGFGKGSEGILKPLLDDVAKLLEDINFIYAVHTKDTAFLGGLGAARMEADEYLATINEINNPSTTQSKLKAATMQTYGGGAMQGDNPVEDVADAYAELEAQVAKMTSSEKAAFKLRAAAMEDKERLLEVDKHILDIINKTYLLEIDQRLELDDLLAKGKHITEAQADRANALADELGILGEINAEVSEHLDKAWKLKKFNASLSGDVMSINIKHAADEAYKKASAEEKLLETEVRIAEVLKEINGLKTDDFTGLRKNREAFNKLKKQLIALLTEQAAVQNALNKEEDDAIENQQALKEFNASLSSDVKGINIKHDADLSYKKATAEERLLQTKVRIKEVTASINNLNTQDFTQLKENSAAFVKLKQELVALLTEQAAVQKEIDTKEKAVKFDSPTLDTKTIDNRAFGEQSELDQLQEEWQEIEKEYDAHLQKIEDSLFTSEAAKKAEMDKLNEQYLRAQATFQMALIRTQLQTASTMFADLATIASAYAGEQSGIYKAMFAVSKAFAIVDAGLKLHMALMNALASGPFPANLGAMATVASAGAGLIGQIMSATASFEGGGFTGKGGRSGGVDGRGGFPAILHPNEMITDLTKGGEGSGITVIVNNLPGQDADTRPSEDGKRMEITIKRVKQEIASEFRRGAGDVNKSLSMRDKRMGVGK